MLTFRTFLAATVLASASLGTASAADARQSPATEQQQQRPRNVLLIMADDLAPRLGVYGAPVRTPNLDALAKSGLVFDRAYCQFPWCGPSRASMLTGMRPNSTKVMDLWTPFRKALPDIQTLPQYFKENGWFAGRVGKIYHQGVPGDIGTSGPDDPQSWTEVVNPRGHDKDVEEQGKLVSLTPGIPYGSAQSYYADEADDAEQTDGKVATATIDMIRKNKDKPFFIAAGFYRPHVPEVVPQKYFDMYPLDSIRIADETAESLKSVPDYTKAWTPDHFGMTSDEQRKMIRAYYAATTFMDAQVGRVIAALQAEGLADDTIVVFTSDHGFLLGERGQWMKNVLWDGSSRVPLIIRAPGVAKAGGRSGKMAELVDLYPTLTDLVGLPRNARNEGSSLVPLLKRPNDKAWAEAAFSQVRGGRSVHTERYRYTEWEEGKLGTELYDHRTDPGEKTNLAGQPKFAKVQASLKAMLPVGAVEKRTPPARYNPVKDCLILPPMTPAAAASMGASRPAGGGEGGGGLQACEREDP